MKIIILCQSQFGYHFDTWYYAKYLKNDSINYICWDYGHKKKALDNVCVDYVGRNSNAIKRIFNYLKCCSKSIRQVKPDCVFIKYFKLCFLLRILHPRTKFIFDVRTGDINKTSFKVKLNDLQLKFESQFFTNISIISASLRDRLNFSKNSYILPLGAEVLSPSEKLIDVIKLVYMGTLTGRDIHKTVEGLKLFIDKNKMTRIHYDIIGSGWGKEEQELRVLVKQYNLEDYVKIHGFIHHEDVEVFLAGANVGVSFIPVTPAFDVQPPTKTFEYLLSNMIVIATKTKENLNVLENNEQYAIAINDTADDFSNALVKLEKNKSFYNDRVIDNRFEKYLWVNIVADFSVFLAGIVKRNEK